MATISELDSFVLKFKQLWKSGHDAHLDVESKAGKAWVSIRLCLADEPGPLHQPFNLAKTISSSRERRRIRRQVARKENTKTEAATEEEVAVSDISDSKAAANVAVTETEGANLDLEPQEVNIAEKAEEEKLVTVSEAAAEASDIEESNEIKTSASLDIIETEEAKLNNVENATIDGKESSKIGDKVNQFETESKPFISAVETVFATTVIGKTQSSQVSNAHLDALLSIIKSKEHLDRNIVSVNMGSVQSYQLQCGKFEHLVQVIIYVNTANLWESSRSYLFHHLGRDTWNLRDGTEITFKRIHLKT